MRKYIMLVSRVGAFIIDYIPFYILLYFLGNIGVLGYVICLIILFSYRYISTSMWGATLGMFLLKLKLNRFDFKICLKREIIRFASAFFYLGYIYAIFDPKGRAFHDIASETMVMYRNSKEKDIKSPFILKGIIYVILVISILRWSSSFILNDIGDIGLKKICSSDRYFQSFEGDNLLSLSQKELYMKTLGRKYTALVDIGAKPYIIRISNKLKYTEVYKLNIINSKMIGEYLYRVDMPIQYICSGTFRNKRELCGISPTHEIILVDEFGKIYGKSKIKLNNILSLKCGDVDSDGKAEAVIINRDGDVEIFKYTNGNLNIIYNGKVGEDIIPQAFYIDKGIVALAKGDNKSILLSYSYKNGKFVFNNKKYIKVDEISSMSKTDQGIILSNINRNNMAFNVGNLQTLMIYSEGSKARRLYDFGTRPSRKYAYTVKNLEEVYDIDNDGNKEIILKSVNKDDVMGQGYKIEVYKLDKSMLHLNRILSKIETILSLGRN